MNDYFYLQFSSTEQIAHGFVQDSQNLSDVAQRLQRAVQGLYASGLQGAFVATFQSRMESMQAMLRYFYDETDESGHDLLTVVQMARDLDATAARRFSTTGAGFTFRQGVEFTQTQSLGSVPAYFVPDFVRERIGNEYGLYSYVKDADSMFKGSEKLAESVLIKGEKITSKLFKTKTGFAKTIIDSSALPIGLGVAGGIADWAFSDDHSAGALLTQTTSGGIQGVISLHPVGAAVLLGDTVVQFAGHGVSQLMEDNAMALANGDPVLASKIQDTANKYQDALDAMSLDSRIDGMVSAVFSGDLNGVVAEIGTGVWGLGNAVVYSNQLNALALQSLESHVGELTSIDETVYTLSNMAEKAVGDIFRIFDR